MRCIGEWDLVVVGAGPAGIIAALAAARNGAKTLLIERYGFVGGMAATGLAFLTFHDAHGRQVIRGIPEEMVDRLIASGHSVGHIDARSIEPRFDSITTTPFHPEGMKQVGLEMLLESGVDLRFHSIVVDALVGNHRIAGVVLEGKAGRELVLSQFTVDASGDGDVAARAGADFEKGRSKDGLMQAVSLMCRVGGVDIKTARKFKARELLAMVKQANEKGEVPADVGGIWPSYLPTGEVTLNMTSITRIDGTSVEDLTRAEIEARRQIPILLNFLRTNVPGYERVYLVETAPMMGIRETRRILGDYVLTEHDVLRETQFSDSIAQSSYGIDIHNPTGLGTYLKALEHGGSHGIPYRCLLPRKVDGLLTAGRCISATHEASAAIRVMATCMATGQAAGTAAALSVKSAVPPRDLDIQALQKKLVEQNAVVD